MSDSEFVSASSSNKNTRKRLPGDAGRCTKLSSKKKYSKKRHFAGNQYTKEKKKTKTVSEKKIEEIVVDVDETLTERPEGYRLFDMDIFQEILSAVLCPECCNEGLTVEEDDTKRKGLANFILVKCTNCGFTLQKYTSKTVQNIGKPGMQSFDANLRSAYAFIRCGLGHRGIEKFCGMMNMPPPMARKNYDKLSNKICDVVEKVAKSSMLEAASNLKQTKGTDVGVSVDGTWQKRGFSSLDGVVVTISVSSGKVLDCQVLSRTCKSCNMHSSLQQTNKEEYEKWKIKHINDCKLNHKGSSPSMENAGAVSIFSRSVVDRGLRSLSYYGDGDSKSFASVENIYEGAVVKKFECIGHYQKRVGNRLRKLKKSGL